MNKKYSFKDMRSYVYIMMSRVNQFSVLAEFIPANKLVDNRKSYSNVLKCDETLSNKTALDEMPNETLSNKTALDEMPNEILHLEQVNLNDTQSLGTPNQESDKSAEWNWNISSQKSGEKDDEWADIEPPTTDNPPKTKIYKNTREESAEIKEKYLKKIQIISKYFNISNDAAIYIYHRRKRSFPWQRKGDEKYLYWNIKLFSSLIALDKIIDFDWKSLSFGNEEVIFQKYDIDTEDIAALQKCVKDILTVRLLTPSKNAEDGWQQVNTKTKKVINPDIKILQSIGLLPRKDL